MSHPRGANDTRDLADDSDDRSIGIIPGLIRSTYRSAIKIGTAIAHSGGLENASTPRIKPKTHAVEIETVKTSVYRLPEDFGPSEMPCTWKQSVESLTAALEALDVGSSETEGMRLNGGFIAGSRHGGGCKEYIEVAGEVSTAEKCKAAPRTRISESSVDSTSRSTSDDLPEYVVPVPIHELALMNSRTLLKFQPFKRLPPEIRIKIWGLAAKHRRIIGFQFIQRPERGDEYVYLDDHAELRIYARSAMPPLLEVNRESRGECRKLYRKRVGPFIRPFWYNPDTDVLYFSGANICYYALSRAFWGVEEDSPTVAFNISSPTADCCRGAMESSIVSGTIRSLHGFMTGPTDERPNQRSFHCQGLKEVLLVMGSRPMAMLPSRINPSTCFRPASTTGITSNQEAVRKKFEVAIARIHDEKPYLFGPNAWVGEDKPTFSFVNLARDKAGELFQTLTASRFEVSQLKIHHSSFIHDLRQSTGCKIILPHQIYDDEFPMEIGIKGSKEGVEVCCRKIQDMISLHT